MGVKTSTAVLNADTAYYLYARIKTANNAIRIHPEVNSFHSGSNTFELLSGVYFGASTTFFVLDKRADGSASITWEVDTMGAYNITEFKDKGVKNDTGTLFSVLTNSEIKAKWTYGCKTVSQTM